MVVGFFFQAEDGIRDYKVTGVQTCALPIFAETSFFSGSTCLRSCFSQFTLPSVVEMLAIFDDGCLSPTLRRAGRSEIGRASCRERGEIGGGDVGVYRQKGEEMGREAE